jgi:hypothetical protein
MSTPDGAVTRYGAEALRLATVLLQRMRQTRPASTIWEAADVQWWSRQERPTDRDGQLFWLDERGEPAAAVLATDFGHSVQHDVLIMIKDRSVIRLAWRTAIARASQTRGAGHEFRARLVRHAEPGDRPRPVRRLSRCGPAWPGRDAGHRAAAGLHYRAGGDYAENGIDPGRIAEIDTRYADAMLARLASPRPPGLAALTCDTQVCTVTGSTARWPGAPRCSAIAGPC